MADCAAYVSLPLLSLSTKAVFGEDLLAAGGVDWKPYSRLVGERPHPGLQRDVQIEFVLRFEVERHVRRLEERQVRMIVQLVEGMQRLRGTTALRLFDLERACEAKAEEIFVELARFLGIAAAVGVVVQFLDHGRFSLGNYLTALPSYCTSAWRHSRRLLRASCPSF